MTWKTFSVFAIDALCRGCKKLNDDAKITDIHNGYADIGGGFVSNQTMATLLCRPCGSNQSSTVTPLIFDHSASKWISLVRWETQQHWKKLFKAVE